MNLNESINLILGIIFIACIILGVRSSRKRSESKTGEYMQESFRRQDESRKLLKDMLDAQQETNTLIRQLIDRIDKK